MLNDAASPDAYSPERYNALVSVEINHRRRLELEDTFNELHRRACEIVAGSQLAFDLGIYLLHRHWSCGANDAMCESRGKWRRWPALITRSTKRVACQAPTRWSGNDDGDLVPLEFSDDPDAVRIVGRVLSHERLLRQLVATIDDAHLLDVVGLSILRRDAVPQREGERLIEENFGGMSVVVARKPKSNEEATLIPTTWSLDIHAGCKPACRCQPYSINECRHHTKVHTYKVCVPACVEIDPPLPNELPNKSLQLTSPRLRSEPRS